MIANLLKRLVFKVYFLSCSLFGGRDAGIPRWVARHVVGKVGFVPMHRDGIYIGLNPVGFIDWCLMARGGFEPGVKKVVHQALQDGGIMLDIGANIGVFSLAAAQLPNVEVIAFEPSPRELQRLHRNVALNPDLPIIVMPYACGRESGTERMFQASSDNTGANSMAQEPDAESFKTITIRTIVPGQLLHADVLRKVKLVKIDVEGYEHVVLEGLEDSMEQLKHAVFILEINPPCLERAGSSPEWLYAFFKNHGLTGVLGVDTPHTDEEGKYDEVFYHPALHGDKDVGKDFLSLLV